MDVLQACVRYPPAPGGVEDHVQAIARKLHDRGHGLEVVTSDLHTETPWTRLPDDHADDEPFPVRRHRAWTPGGEAHYVTVPGMVPSMLGADADIVHAHSYGYFQTHVARLKQALQGTPLVLTTHFHPAWSMVGGTRRRRLRGFYDRWIGPRVLEAADAVVCVSSTEADRVAELGVDRDRIEVVPNGVHLDRFDDLDDGAAFREATGIEGEYVLFAGRLAVNKGLDVLVDAWRRLDVDAELAIVGEDQGVWAELAEQAPDDVHATGFLPADAYVSALSGAECLVLPSEYEAFGIVLVEAMACGTPTVATRVGGVPDVVDDGETGLLVDHGDPDALAEAIGELLDDPKRRDAMGQAGRARVEERFTWGAVVDDLETVYGRVSRREGG